MQWPSGVSVGCVWFIEVLWVHTGPGLASSHESLWGLTACLLWTPFPRSFCMVWRSLTVDGRPLYWISSVSERESERGREIERDGVAFVLFRHPPKPLPLLSLLLRGSWIYVPRSDICTWTLTPTQTSTESTIQGVIHCGRTQTEVGKLDGCVGDPIGSLLYSIEMPLFAMCCTCIASGANITYWRITTLSCIEKRVRTAKEPALQPVIACLPWPIDQARKDTQTHIRYSPTLPTIARPHPASSHFFKENTNGFFNPNTLKHGGPRSHYSTGAWVAPFWMC
jgi:hypothetical protein